MNDLDLHDDPDAALESLLRATFRHEATRRLPDDRPVPAPELDQVAPAPRSHRRRIGLAAVAAGLVAAGTAAAIIGHEALVAAPAPTPAATDVRSVAPSLTPTPQVTGTASPTTSPPATASSTPAATKQMTFQGVVLTVPTTWNAVTRPVGDAGETPSVCLTTDTAIRSTGAGSTDNCQLDVSVGAALWGSQDVDRVGFAPDGGLCGTDRHTPHQTDTVVADEVAVDGQTAEHREFTGSCLDQSLDQWSVSTAPFVQFWRATAPADAAGRAQALEVVRSARLPGPRSTLRLTDRGYVTAVSGDTLSLDRITELNQLGVQNVNPATYDYPLAADVVVTYGGSTMSTDQLRALAAGQTVAGVPALDTLEAELTTNGSQVTALTLTDR